MFTGSSVAESRASSSRFGSFGVSARQLYAIVGRLASGRVSLVPLTAPIAGSPSRFGLTRDELRYVVATLAVVASFTVLRAICAATADLRVDEVYYWTWSRENVVSYLDHPPAIAWLVRASTFVMGDTNLGVRFPGLAAMLAMELLIADIVWRATRDIRCACIAVLL